MSEQLDPHDKNPAEHRLRMRFDWDNLIEDLIEEGRQKGVFDNLPGQGKPLDLKRNTYAPDTELANELLKKNDTTPIWIANRNRLLAHIALLREELAQSWERHEREYHVAQDAGIQGSLNISWDDDCLHWEAKILKLNKQIDDFNLTRPSDKLEIYKLILEKELARIGARRWLMTYGD